MQVCQAGKPDLRFTTLRFRPTLQFLCIPLYGLEYTDGLIFRGEGVLKWAVVLRALCKV